MELLGNEPNTITKGLITWKNQEKKVPVSVRFCTRTAVLNVLHLTPPTADADEEAKAFSPSISGPLPGAMHEPLLHEGVELGHSTQGFPFDELGHSTQGIRKE